MNFLEALDQYRGDDEDSADISCPLVPVYEYDLTSGPIRMWPGFGRLHTIDGRKWLGTVDSSGVDHHQAPGPRDGRDGTSAKMTFGLPYIDRETYNQIRLVKEESRDRPVRVYLCVLLPNEGLRPQTPLRFQAEYTLISPLFDSGLTWDEVRFIRRYSVSIIGRDGNQSRALADLGTYTSTGQRDRAAEFGIAVDRGCDFVAALENVTVKPQ